MDVCTLAQTGINMFVIIGVAIALVVAALLVFAKARRISVRYMMAILVLPIIVACTIPTQVFAEELCIPSMVLGVTSGQEGQVQIYNVVQHNTPTPGSAFIASSLRLALRAGSPVGSAVLGDSTTVSIPGQGTFVANSDGTITFTPESDYVGTSTGVAYTIVDTAGGIGSSTYTPSVTSGVVTCIDATTASAVLKERTLSFAGYDGEQVSTPLLAGGTGAFSAVASSADGTKLVATESGGYIYTSNDSGVSWTIRASSGIRGWHAVASSADGTKLVATESGGYIYTSNDSGVSWTEQTASDSRSWWSIASSADGTKLVAGVYGGYIYTSNDSGVSWTEQTASGMRDGWSITSSADGTKLAAAVYDGYIYTSNDSGVSWTEQTASDSRSWRSIASSVDGTKLAAAVYGGHIYTSNDSGVSWTEQTASGIHFWTPLASSADGVKLTTTESGGHIYTSNDSGVSWTEQTASGIHSWSGIASSTDGTKLVAAVYGGYIYTSNDSGVSWTEHHLIPIINPDTVDIDLATIGLQYSLDMSATEGWTAVYDANTDIYTVTVTNAVLFAENQPRVGEYTLYTDGCTQPVPARITMNVEIQPD